MSHLSIKHAVFICKMMMCLFAEAARRSAARPGARGAEAREPARARGTDTTDKRARGRARPTRG